MRLSRTISKVVARRSTVLSIVVVAAALSWSGAEACAGVIVPWTQDVPVSIQFELPLDAVGSSSAPADPAPSPIDNHNENRKIAGMNSLDGLAQTGGASTPTSGTSGQITSAAVAILDVPVARPVTRSFGYLRETTPRLPHPPLGELLDPPKACA